MGCDQLPPGLDGKGRPLRAKEGVTLLAPQSEYEPREPEGSQDSTCNLHDRRPAGSCAARSDRRCDHPDDPSAAADEQGDLRAQLLGRLRLALVLSEIDLDELGQRLRFHQALLAL